MIVDAFRVWALALRDLWDNLLPGAMAYNLFWLLLCLLVVPAGPATVALFYVANLMVHRQAPVYVSEYFGFVRRFFGVGLRWGAANFVALALIIADTLLTRQMDSVIAAIGLRFFVGVLVAWIMLQIYALPLLFEQEEPSLRLALRNASVLLLRNPFFSLTLVLLIMLVELISTLLVFVVMMIGGIFAALAGNHAVLNRLDAYRADVPS